MTHTFRETIERIHKFMSAESKTLYAVRIPINEIPVSRKASDKKDEDEEIRIYRQAIENNGELDRKALELIRMGNSQSPISNTNITPLINIASLPAPLSTLPTTPIISTATQVVPEKEDRKRKSFSPGTITKVWRSVYSDFEAVCIMCKETPIKLEERQSWHVSHVIPFSKGGSDELENLRPLCSKCNHRMSNQSFKDYIMAWHEDRYALLMKAFNVK
jgi:hypothetical protein